MSTTNLIKNFVPFALLLFAAACSSSGTSSVIPAASRTDSLGTLSSSVQPASATSTFTSALLADDPRAFYTFGGATNVLTDASANHLNGSYGGSVRIVQPPIVGNGATAEFPGGAWAASNIATVPPNALFQSAQVSVEAWFIESAANSGPHYQSIVSYGSEAHGQQFVLHVTPQNVAQIWLKTTTGAAIATSNAALVVGKLYQVVGTYDGQHASIFVNGVGTTGQQIASSAIAYDGSGQLGLALGGALASDWTTFDGKLGAAAIFPSVLSASRIAAHYAAGIAAAPTGTPSPSPAPAATLPPASTYDTLVQKDAPAALYPLADTSTTAVDLSASHNDGSYDSGIAHVASDLTSATTETAKFPGTAAVAVMPRLTQVEPASSLSVEAWISETAQTSGAFRTILCVGCNGQEPAYVLQLTPQNSLHFWLQTTTGASYATTVQSLTPGQVYHVVGTYDGATASIYVDGRLVSSIAKTGALRGYSPGHGLIIGGSSNGDGFPGSVNEVAIYPRALSSQDVLAHFTAGVYAPFVTERPSAAATFVDSVGIDFVYPGVSNWSSLETSLVASGIKHVREGLAQNSTVASRLNDLASKGVKSTLTTALNIPVSQVPSILGETPQAIDMIEGPNEPDLTNGDWEAATRSYMSALHSTIEGSSTYARYSIVAPALSGGQSSLGDISADVAYGNMHDYFADSWPETTGYGGIYPQGVYGSLAYNINLAKIETASRPIISTETGWGSTSNGSATTNDVPFGVAAKYLLRVYLTHFNAGVPRTFAYTFEDGTDPTNGFNYYGLVEANGTPKPEYYALKSLLSILADASAGSSPLSYRIAGDTGNVEHTLLQRSDGSYDLVLWLGVSGWNTATHAVIDAPAQSVSVTLQNGLKSATTTAIDDAGAAHTSTLVPTNDTVTLPVTDSVQVIHLQP